MLAADGHRASRAGGQLRATSLTVVLLVPPTAPPARRFAAEPVASGGLSRTFRVFVQATNAAGDALPVSSIFLKFAPQDLQVLGARPAALRARSVSSQPPQRRQARARRRQLSRAFARGALAAGPRGRSSRSIRAASPVAPSSRLTDTSASSSSSRSGSLRPPTRASSGRSGTTRRARVPGSRRWRHGPGGALAHPPRTRASRSGDGGGGSAPPDASIPPGAR